jgi:hypothetical protein
MMLNPLIMIYGFVPVRSVPKMKQVFMQTKDDIDIQALENEVVSDFR